MFPLKSGKALSNSNYHIALHSNVFEACGTTHKPGGQVFKRRSDLPVVLLSGVSSTRMWLDHTTTLSNYRSTCPQSGLNNHKL